MPCWDPLGCHHAQDERQLVRACVALVVSSSGLVECLKGVELCVYPHIIPKRKSTPLTSPPSFTSISWNMFSQTHICSHVPWAHRVTNPNTHFSGPVRARGAERLGLSCVGSRSFRSRTGWRSCRGQLPVFFFGEQNTC